MNNFYLKKLKSECTEEIKSFSSLKNVLLKKSNFRQNIPFKKLSFGKRKKTSGRNSTGSITIFHRGGGSKRLHRKIDFIRNCFYKGIIERIEYDPNRSCKIALVRWQHSISDLSTITKKSSLFFSYILASDEIKSGDIILNLDNSKFPKVQSIFQKTDSDFNFALNYKKIGNSAPIGQIPEGSFIHNIEIYPGKGGQLVRSAGTSAQLLSKKISPYRKLECIIRLPSGVNKVINPSCRATLGIISNQIHNTTNLTKAGQNRWLGKKPTVRGVAMNPIDHPHGGGEGRTKGGRPSVSPWGKPTKGGFKTVYSKKKTHKK
uniref:Ribosomal protein L2 n=1 Tax=Roya anglica TaxID=43943 RepID=A0A6G9IGK2_9VIRI|nr:ribosomal protein L2 [Roya anglica]QIQ22974.1 ribosomal protein L2 [Roya anglica]